jgi:hypothetical protein
MADQDDDEANPFAAPQSDLVSRDVEVDARDRQRSHQLIDAGDVIGTSWEIFKVDFGITVGGMFLGAVLINVCSLPQNILQIVGKSLIEHGDPQLGSTLSILSICCLPLTLGGQVFLQLGQARLLLNIARGDHAQVSDLFSGGRYFWRMLGATILYGLMLALGFVACVIPCFILGLMFCCYAYSLIDEDPPGMGCLSRAREATKDNLVALLVIGLAAIGINFLGLLMFCVGIIATFPLTGLMFAVAYCKMTGQRTVSSLIESE